MALYKSLVRPYLEYSIPVWNHYLVKDVKLIEGIQRRVTKIMRLFTTNVDNIMERLRVT